MVAVVSGNGLGLFNSSLTQLGSPVGGQAGIGQNRGAQYVNVATGNLVLQDQDETLVARGLSTSFLRTYSSRGTVTDQGQDGWVSGYERRVTGLTGTVNTAGSTVKRIGVDGNEVVFTWDASRSAYLSTVGAGAHDTLTWASSQWTWTEGSTQSQEVFDSTGKLTTLRDTLSGAEYAVAYFTSGNGAGQVQSVLSATGDGLLFTYDSSHRLETTYSREGGTDKVQVAYGYDSYGRLAWVQHDLTPDNAMGTWDGSVLASSNDNGLRFRTTFAYVAASASDLRIASVTQSDGNVLSYTYESDGSSGYRVKTVTHGSGGAAQTLTFTYSANSTDVTDAQGDVWTYQYDASKQLTAILAPAISGQRDTTTYTYDASGNITQAKTERGASLLSKVDYEYDTSGNLTWQWSWEASATGAMAIQRTYTAANQLATETVYTGLDQDGVGATYAPTGTGLTSRYFYDGQNRLLFAVDATGAVRELTYNAGGNGIGQLASERRYTGASYAGSWDVTSLQSWTTSTQKADSQLTSYTYDAKGRLQETVAYVTVQDAGQTTPGAGVLNANDATDITRYIYDAQGLLLQQVKVRGTGRALDSATSPTGSEVTTYIYDGLGRLTSTIRRDWSATATDDATTVKTTVDYLDSARQILTTLDSSATRRQTFDTAGRVVDVEDSGVVSGATVTRTTHNYYNSDGELRAVEDASGGRTYFFYDVKGRLEATVDATGAVVRHQYDGADRRLSSTQYANRVTTTSWVSSGAVTVANFAAISVTTDSVNDRTSTRTFDLSGRVATETDAAGLVTAYAYDGAGRLSSVTVSKPGDGAVTPRVTRYLYDAAGRLSATVDAANYVTEQVYDAAGRLARSIRYATATSSPTATTLASLRPSTHANDQTTRYFYNGRGQVIGTLNAEGYLSEAIIDEEGNTRAERVYAEQLTGLSGTESFATLRTNAQANDLPETEKYRETKNAYNGLGQLFTQTNAEGTLTKFYYDEAGRLVRTVAAENASTATEIRENYRRYNVFDELVGELTGEQVFLAGTLIASDPDTAYSQYGTRHNYDALGRLIESIGPAGIGVSGDGDKVWYFYDAQGRQTFVVRGVAQDNNGTTTGRNTYAEVTETRYSAFGEVIDSLAYTGRIAIPVAGDRTSVATLIVPAMLASALNSRRQYGYDTRGLLAQVTDATSAITKYSYTAFGQRYDTTTAFGTAVVSTSRSSYDVRGLETGRIDGLSSAVQRSSSHAFDAFGRVTSATDARGNATTFTYDRLGRQISRSQSVTSEGSARAETWTTSYDAFDRVLTQTDPLGKGTTYQYDTNARSVTVTTYEGVKVQTVHNRHGQTVTVTTGFNTALAATTTTTYDRNGAVTSITNALGQTTTYDHDKLRNLLVLTTDASGRKVGYTYDAVRRVLSRIEDPGTGTLNLTTTYVYDAQGRQLKVTDASGRVTTMSYDGEGRLTQTAQDPSGLNLRTSYTYDEQGQQVTVTEGYGTAAARTVKYVYDALGRRTSEIVDPGAGKLNLTTSYLYDANGNAVQRTDATGNITRFVYDEANRQTHVVNAGGGVSKTIYDKAGRVVATRQYTTAIVVSDLSTTAGVAASVIKSRTDAIADNARDLVTYRVYDTDGRLRYSIDGLGGVTETRYDAAGRASDTLAYTATITLDTTLKAKLLTGDTGSGSLLAADIQALLQTRATLVWDTGFEGNSLSGFDTSAGIAPTMVDGRAGFGRNPGTSGFQMPVIVAPGLHTLAEGITYYTEISTGASTAGTYLELGIQNEAEWGTSGFRRDAIVIQNGSLIRQQYDGATTTPVTLMTLATNTTYVVETETATDRVTTYIYAKGGDRSQGVSFTRSTTSAGYGQALWFAVGEHAPGVSGNAVYLDNLSATTRAHAQLQATRYDAADRVVRSVDALGNVTEYGYDAAGRRIRVTDALGNTSHVAYDAAGRQRYTIDALGAVTEASYNAAGQGVATRAYANAISASSLASALASGPLTDTVVAGLLTADAARDGLAYTVYDAAGRASFAVDALGHVRETRYDTAGRVTESLDYGTLVSLSAGDKTALTNGSMTVATMAGKVSGQQGSARLSQLVYDSAGRFVYSLTRGDANQAIVSERRYDAAGRVIADVAYAKTITYAANQTTTDVANALTSVGATAANQQRLTRYAYDVAGRLRFTLDDAGAVTEQRYDAMGQVLSSRQYVTTVSVGTATEAAVASAVSGQGNARITSHVYDIAGRLTSTTDALNKTEVYGYDAAGRRTSFTNKLNAVWNYEYDAAGRLTVERSPTVSVARFNGSGAVVVESKSIVTTMTYDARGNVLSRTENAEASDVNERRKTQYVYDKRGQQIKTIFPDSWKVNASGVLVANGSNPDIQVAYDAFGHAVAQKDVLGYHSYKVYDVLGRVAYDIDAAGYVTSYTYDAFGAQTGLVRHVNPLNTTVSAFTSVSWTAGTAISVAQVQAGLTTHANDRSLTTTFDVLGRKTAAAQSQVSYVTAAGTEVNGTPTTQFVYDAYGNLVSESVLVDPTAASGSQWATTYHYYDELGRQTLSVDAGGYVTTWAYDAVGAVVSQTEYARAISLVGISTATPPSLPAAGDEVIGYDRTTTFAYDALGRRTSETLQRRFATSTGGSVQRDVVKTIGYDALDHVTSTSEDGVATSMVYDALGRVSSVTESDRDVLKSNAESLLLAANGTTLASTSLYNHISPYTTTVYDAFGNAVQVRRYANGWSSGSATADTARDQVSTTRYDYQGRAVIESVVTGASEATTQQVYRNYDAADHLTRVWFTRLGSEASRNQTVQTDVTYDAVGRQLTSVTQRIFSGSSVTDASEAVGYNAFGEIVAKAAILADIGVANKSVSFIYDKAGRMIQSDADGVVRHYGYNLAGVQRMEWHLGRVNGATTATAVTTMQSVDLLGRIVKTVLPSYATSTSVTATLSRRYDRWGNVLEQTDPRGFATQYAYNDRNQAIRETKPQVAVLSESGVETWQRPTTEYYYDVMGRLVGIRDANGHLKQNVYDASGTLLRTIDAAGQVSRQAHDAFGQNALTQDALGYITFRSFDRIGRIAAHGDYLPDSAGTARAKTTLESYTLDADGNRIGVTNALSQTQLYDYDSRGLLTRSQSATGVTAFYEYDATGRKTKESDASDYQTWGYAYDGHLTAHRDLGAANYTYTYASDSGQLIGQSSDRAVSTGHIVTRWWEDDPNLYNDSGFSTTDTTQELFSRSTTYYANGQVKEITDASNKLSYRYEYDASGNRTMEETDTVDGQGKHIFVRTRITYDGHNRIIQVTSDDLLTGARTLDVRYDYDAVGNRRRVTSQSGYGPTTQAISTANQAPETAAVVPNRNIKYGVAASFTLSMTDYFNDPEQAALSYTVTQANGSALPGWLTATYDATTGELTFNATSASTNGQTLSIKIVASDGNTSTSQTFTVQTVSNTTPELLSGTTPTVTIKKNQLFDFSLDAADFFTDRDVGDRLTLSLVSITGGNSGWLNTTTSAQTPDRLWFSGTGPNSAGTRTITIRATDANGASITKAITLDIVTGAAPTVAQAIPAQAVNIGRGFAVSRDLSQVFTVANAGDLTIAAKLSNGAELPSWMRLQYNPAGAPPRLALIGQSPPTATAGTAYTITITATDSDGQSVSTNFTLTLQTPPTNSNATSIAISNQSATANTAWSFTVPANTFTDSNGDSLYYQASLYSTEEIYDEELHPPYQTIEIYEVLPSWLQFNGTTRTFSGTAPVAGTYDIAVRVADGSGTLKQRVFTLTVAAASTAAPPVVYAPANDIVVTRGQSMSVAVGFLDANGGTLTYTVRQAGGAALPSWLSFSSSTMTFTGTPPSNMAPTTYTIEIVATDSTSLTAMDTFTIEVVATASNGGAIMKREAWYTYDEMDRVTVVNGSLVNGQIVLGFAGVAGDASPYLSSVVSYGQGYDAMGRAIANYSKAWNSDGLNISQSVYNLRGQLQLNYHQRPLGISEGATSYWGSSIAEQRSYDAAGHLTESRTFFGPNQLNNGLYLGPVGWLQRGEAYTYDADGRVTEQISYNRPKGWASGPESNQTLSYQSGSGASTLAASMLTKISTATLNYDSLGRLGTRTYLQHAWAREDASVTVAAGYTHTFTYTYEKRDSYLEKTVTGSSTDNLFRATTSTSQYDSYGRRVEVREDTVLKDHNETRTNLRYFAYDAELGIVSRRDGKLENNAFDQTASGDIYGYNKNQHYVYANGQQIARYNEVGEVDAISGLTAYDQGGEVSQATVLSGDTLQIIAQRVYGNSSLWYVLAAANGFASESEIPAGITLKVPDVKVSSNDANTFRPYNPGEVIGPTTPSLPYIGPPTELTCKQQAIQIVATIIRVIAARFGGPLGAMMADALMQKVEMNTGLRDHYSLGQSVAAGIFVAGGAMASTLGKVGQVIAMAGTAAAAYVANTEIEKARGEDVHFAWRSLLAATATAVISHKLGAVGSVGGGSAMNAATSGGFSWGQVAMATMQNVGIAVLNKQVTHMITGEKQNWDMGAMAVDAFGNVLGSYAVSAMLAKVMASDPNETLAKTPGDISGKNFAKAGVPVSGGDFFAGMTPDDYVDQIWASNGRDPLAANDGMRIPVKNAYDRVPQVMGTDGANDTWVTTGGDVFHCTPDGRSCEWLSLEKAIAIEQAELEQLQQRETDIRAQRILLEQKQNQAPSEQRITTLETIEVKGTNERENPYVAQLYVMAGLGVLRQDVFERQARARAEERGVDYALIASLPRPQAPAPRPVQSDSEWLAKQNAADGREVLGIGVGTVKAHIQAAYDFAAYWANGVTGYRGHPYGGGGRFMEPIIPEGEIFDAPTTVGEAFGRDNGLIFTSFLPVGPAIEYFALAKGGSRGLAFNGMNAVERWGGYEGIVADTASLDSALRGAVNPRLTRRLDAWRSYQANGGEMDLQQWVGVTQRHYGGVSGGYRSGFAAWARSIEGVHGNSLLANGPHDVYVIRNLGTGELLHFGETGRGYLTRFAEHQRVFAKQGLEINVDLLRTVDGKAAAKVLELKYIQTYTKTFGQRPPYNPVNH